MKPMLKPPSAIRKARIEELRSWVQSLQLMHDRREGNERAVYNTLLAATKELHRREARESGRRRTLFETRSSIYKLSASALREMQARLQQAESRDDVTEATLVDVTAEIARRRAHNKAIYERRKAERQAACSTPSS